MRMQYQWKAKQEKRVLKFVNSDEQRYSDVRVIKMWQMVCLATVDQILQKLDVSIIKNKNSL